MADTRLQFIDANPATAAYRDSMRFDLQQRQGESTLEGQDLSNEFVRGSMPSRLRSAEAGADYASTRADVARGTAPYEISKAGSEASLAATSAGVARETVPSRVSQVESGARTARAGADVAEGTVPSRIAQVQAGARSATAGARREESNANVTERTEDTRVKSANVGLRQQEANALNSEMQSFYKSLDLLNAGRIDEAVEVARQAGQTIPLRVIQDAEARAAVTQAAKNALAAYPGRPRDQQTYIKAFIDDMSVRQAEGQAASTPTAPYEVPNAPQPPEQGGITHRYDWLPGTQDGVTGPWKVDRNTGERTFEPGTTITSRAGSTAGGAGRQSVFQQKQAAWLAVHPNDQQGALDYASGRRQMSESEIAKSALSMARGELNANTMMKFRPPAEQTAFVQKRAGEIAHQIRSGFGAAPAAPAAAPTAPAAPRPARPAVIGPSSATQPPPGAGTRDQPYEAATQADIDWFRANAPAGSVLRANGQLFTK
ncbi:MAG: hypothetical protein IT537_03150 [Hyphomicrobiales bacterium]|nr:hypothetical protein [Hyphomicrobiales bacterium]